MGAPTRALLTNPHDVADDIFTKFGIQGDDGRPQSEGTT